MQEKKFINNNNKNILALLILIDMFFIVFFNRFVKLLFNIRRDSQDKLEDIEYKKHNN